MFEYSYVRYYNSSTGRFISEDPIGFEGRDANLYRYVKNNSVLHKDPSGEILHFICAGGALAGAGVAITAASITESDRCGLEYGKSLVVSALKGATFGCVAAVVSTIGGPAASMVAILTGAISGADTTGAALARRERDKIRRRTNSKRLRYAQ
mgnify:CR=1 FL=1